jgi:transposase-like protein
MPSKRIPLSYTNKNKLNAVEEHARHGESRAAYCRQLGVPRTTHLTWARKHEKLKVACESRPKSLTIGGSGRKSGTHDIEDKLILWVKDARREELAVSRETIIAECIALKPDFFVGKSEEARFCWCNRFMKRSGLTIRRISHSGRKKKEDLDALKDALIMEVSSILVEHFVDAESSLPPPFVLYNMDQTSVYCHLGATMTVDFKGVKRVPCSLSGKGGYRCTVALTICADGRILIPYFVFKGQLGMGVHEEVSRYSEPDTAAVTVQSSAWFDETVMLDWIEQVWRPEVTGPTVLILDSLRVHKLESVQRAFAEMGTYPVYVPGGATSVAQPLDVGVMGPFKKKLRSLYVEMYTGVSPPCTTHERRVDMFLRTLAAVNDISSHTVMSAFRGAGPFLPYGPSLPGLYDIVDGVGTVV